jgi:hypothetical protein
MCKNGAEKNSSTTASPRSNTTTTPPPEEPQLPRTKLSEEDNNEDAEKEALCHMHDLDMIIGNELLPERGALPLSPRLEGVNPPASKERVLPSHSTTTCMKPLPDTYLPPLKHDHHPCISRRRLHGGGAGPYIFEALEHMDGARITTYRGPIEHKFYWRGPSR